VIRSLTNDKRTKSIPVIIVRADAMSQQIQPLLKAGAKEYIAKPLNIIGFLDIFR